MPAQSPILRKLGENVRAKRESQELSQERLAELAELDRTYISGVERGVRNLSILSASRIAKALKTTLSGLSDGSEILIDQGLRKNPRRLTPRECARLMGYPDNFKITVSDTQAYRQSGNSVDPSRN